MDWLNTIDTNTTVLVPTRGLQSTLTKHYADQQLAAGMTAWETPNIVVWEDYLAALWQVNKTLFSQPKVRLNTEQALLVWQQVIIKSKRTDDELTLLNEQQTARVVQRSWQLLQKWCIAPLDMTQHDDADTRIFAQWVKAYQARLDQQGWIDPVQLEQQVIVNTPDLQHLPTKIVFAYFDLVTASQTRHIEACQKRGVDVEQRRLTSATDNQQYQVYTNKQHELRQVFQSARDRLEQEPAAKIGIVVPTLTEQRQQIEQLARLIFYPDDPPLALQQQGLAYRFSLGSALSDVPYVRSMLIALTLMKPRFRYQDLSFLLRCHWWPQHRHHLKETVLLERLLKQARATWLTWQEVIELWQHHHPEPSLFLEHFLPLVEFHHRLQERAKESQAVQLSAQAWQQLFAQWLDLLGWQENELDSYHYQVHESWLAVLESFAKYDLVQLPIGLNRALRQLQSLCQDKVFMRQAKEEPVLISGVLEAIGQPVDYLYLTGMDETYPMMLPPDPFIPQASLRARHYPFADQATAFDYEKQKINSLLGSAKQVVMSYAQHHDDGVLLPSTLFRDRDFCHIALQPQQSQSLVLEEYRDVEGLPCQHSVGIQGGAMVFENQAKCPFKAYIEHRILRHQDREPEFGLDARDAGIVVHALLENIWRELGSDSQLRLESTSINALVTRHVDAYLAQPDSRFQYDRQRLLQLERSRLIALLEEWLLFEKQQRVAAFRVIGRERSIQSQFGGIPINLVIDRIDQLENGDQIIIDYKTGSANVADWRKKRLASPQLPLYALALEEQPHYTIKGIAFACVKPHELALVGMAEATNITPGIKQPTEDRQPISWQQQLAIWHDNLSELAEQFLAGYAAVDPVKLDTCQYCDLNSVCRVHQLRAQGGVNDVDA